LYYLFANAVITAPEYLAHLAAQAAAAEVAADTVTRAEHVEVPLDYINDLIEALWKANKERCDALYRVQQLEVKNFYRV
jgi:hypothetical protein